MDRNAYNASCQALEIIADVLIKFEGKLLIGTGSLENYEHTVNLRSSLRIEKVEAAEGSLRYLESKKIEQSEYGPHTPMKDTCKELLAETRIQIDPATGGIRGIRLYQSYREGLIFPTAYWNLALKTVNCGFNVDSNQLLLSNQWSEGFLGDAGQLKESCSKNYMAAAGCLTATEIFGFIRLDPDTKQPIGERFSSSLVYHLARRG